MARFADAEPTALALAVARCTDECLRFPVFADVLSRMGPSQQSSAALTAEEAEQAWQHYLDYARENGNLPEGARTGRSGLTAKQRHAGRVAGGINYVESCSADDLVWARKRFIEAYERYQVVEAEGIASLPEQFRQAFGALAESKGLPK